MPGARPCSSLEWVRGARGADGRLYPHGARLAPDDANTFETYGTLSAAGPDEVGAHPASRSPFDLDDMIGNAYLAGPIADGIRFSVAGHARQNDGYIKLIDPNVIGRTIGDAAPYKDRSLRVKLEIDLSDKLTATLGYSNTYNRDDRVQMFSVFDHISPAIPAPSTRRKSGIQHVSIDRKDRPCHRWWWRDRPQRG